MISPKEKAIELVDIYKKEVSITIKDYSLVCKVLDIDMAKQCALIAVEEIIDLLWHTHENETEYRYWQEVKQEIEKL
jgi:hypothetical protein